MPLWFLKMDDPTGQMSGRAKACAALVLAGVLGMAALPGCGRQNGGAGGSTPIDRYREVEDFTFVDQMARDIDRSQFIGKVWVADFVFTSCAAECLVLSKKMQELQEKFAGREDVAFASFSVDPHTDQPPRLAEYAKKWEADPERWHFFTGDPVALDRIIKHSFLLPVARTPREQMNLLTASLIHSNNFAIVDRQAVVRAYIDGLAPDAVDKTSRKIEDLLAEPAGGNG